MGDDWVDNAPKQTELYVKNLSAQQIGESSQLLLFLGRFRRV